MEVSINTSPIDSGHSTRGIGSYTRNLIKEFKRNKNNIRFKFFDNPKNPPKADVVHYPYFDLFFHTLPIKKSAKRVITIHDVIPLVFPNEFKSGSRGQLSYFLQKIALSKSDAVICDSQASKKDIIEKLNFPASKIFVVYLAPSEEFKCISDTKFLKKVSQKYGLPENFVLYVGDVNWNKNILNLLRAISISKVNLALVGKSFMDDSLPQVKEADQLIDSLNIKNKVKKLGFLNSKDLVAIYNLASVTVLPSFYEGFGLPVLESMACGTPVVCSNNSSLSEIGGNLAVYCDPTKPEDIADKIKIQIKGGKNKLIQKKLTNYAQKFSWQETASNTIKVYRNVLKED